MIPFIQNISDEALVEALSILFAVGTFVVAQRIEKAKDRKAVMRDTYQRLELASIELFRFEAGNVNFIRAVWEKHAPLPERDAAEYTVLTNYVCQILNLFELAVSFRRERVLPPEIFGSWVAWMDDLVNSEGKAFGEVWAEVRRNYTPDLRRIMDAGLVFRETEEDEGTRVARFYLFVSELFQCSIVRGWNSPVEDRKYQRLIEQTLRKEIKSIK